MLALWKFCLFSILLYLIVFVIGILANQDMESQIVSLIKSGQFKGKQLSSLYYRLGLYYQQSWFEKKDGGKRLLDAINAYEESLELDELNPFSLDILYNKGVCYKLLGKGKESLQALDDALDHELSPLDEASIHHSIADTYLMLANLPEAIKHYRLAIELDPCKTERYFGLVTSLKEDSKYSKEEWNNLVSVLINSDQTCVNNESIQKNTIPNKLLVNMNLDQSNDSKLTRTNKKSDLYYAIFIAAEKAGMVSTAWEYLVKANTLEKDYRQLKFNRQEVMTMKNNTVNIFNQGMLHSFPDVGKSSSVVPIFIVGLTRSGSTLMETMLDAHPNIWGMGEDSFFNANLTSLRDKIVQITSKPSITPKKSQKLLYKLLIDYGDNTAKQMLSLAKETIRKKKTNERMEIKKVVDKMLFNYRNIGFIHIVYPNALIINMIRDPLDTLFSSYKQKFDDRGLEWTLDISDLVLQYVLYLEYIQHFRELLPGRIVDVKYEELIYHPKKIMKKIINKLSLPWDEKILSFHQQKRSVQTHSQSQVRQKLYTSSIGSWKKYSDFIHLFREEFLRYLPDLKKKKALPYYNQVNWEMKKDFDYEAIYNDDDEEDDDDSDDVDESNVLHDKQPKHKGNKKDTMTSVNQNEL